MSATANRLHTLGLMPGLLTAAEREEHRLDRLRELRATIDSLRQEQTSRDPLLAWVMHTSEGHSGD
jgi:hypothetical protein